MNYLKNVSPSNEPILSAARQSTAAIVQAVRQRGWSAVQEFSARYDGFSGPFRIPRERAVEALSAMSPHVRTALETAVNNVRTFHRLQRDLFRNCTWEIAPGVSAGLRFLPVENVAVYVPGGRYPLPSTAVMGIVAAQEAGVSRIAVLSPPRGPEGIHPVVLGTLGLLGIEEIWRWEEPRALPPSPWNKSCGKGGHDRRPRKCVRHGGQASSLRRSRHRRIGRPERSPRGGG